MARKSPQPKATSSEVLECVQQNCPSCGKPMWNEYNNLRRVRTLTRSSTTAVKNSPVSE